MIHQDSWAQVDEPNGAAAPRDPMPAAVSGVTTSIEVLAIRAAPIARCGQLRVTLRCQERAGHPYGHVYVHASAAPDRKAG
jgi:hypothetical protein